VVLEHPSGCQVLLIGTHHVAATAGNQTAVAVEEHSPSRVVLELDEVLQQLCQRAHITLGCLAAALASILCLANPTLSRTLLLLSCFLAFPAGSLPAAGLPPPAPPARRHINSDGAVSSRRLLVAPGAAAGRTAVGRTHEAVGAAAQRRSVTQSASNHSLATQPCDRQQQPCFSSSVFP
jgi:hypothetical protein